MPLDKVGTYSEFERLTKWYIVSFFNLQLKHQAGYETYLTNSLANQRANPFVNFHKDCVSVPGHSLDFQVGDRVTFTPQGTNYQVAFSRNNKMQDMGQNLNLGDDDQTTLTLPFNLPLPSAIGPQNKLFVSSNGVITTATPLNYFVDFLSSPWMNRGDLLFSGRTIIDALSSDLNPEANPNGGVFANILSDRVVVTYYAVEYFANKNNGGKNTVQVVIYKDGRIEMTFGQLSGTGPSDEYPFNVIHFGIGTGLAKLSDLNSAAPVDFSSLTQPVTLPATAIYEDFYPDNGVASCNSG
jgi:hypothetical protein